jgi:hypothetical protein
VRDVALRGVLSQVHAAVRLLHGSVQQLLDQVAEQDNKPELEYAFQPSKRTRAIARLSYA